MLDKASTADRTYGSHSDSMLHFISIKKYILYYSICEEMGESDKIDSPIFNLSSG
jgi:hypothetical protein